MSASPGAGRDAVMPPHGGPPDPPGPPDQSGQLGQVGQVGPGPRPPGEPLLPAFGVGTVDRRAVGIFLLVAFGVTWAVEGGLALAGGLSRPWAAPTLMLIMFVPMLAAWVACRVTGRPWAPSVGLGVATVAQRRWLRVLALAVVGVLAVLALVGLVLWLSVLLGWLPFDRSMPGLDAALARAKGAKLPPKPVLLLLQLLNIPIAAFTINGVFALGEEAGWRGWLLGALAPLGRSRAILTIGAIWGLWHAPLIAMGYEYSHQVPFVLGAPLFMAFCMGLGTLLAWLRVRAASVVPAAITHGAINASALTPALFCQPSQLRFAWVTIFGVPGVAVMGAVAAVLLWRAPWTPRRPRQLRPNT